MLEKLSNKVYVPLSMYLSNTLKTEQSNPWGGVIVQWCFLSLAR